MSEAPKIVAVTGGSGSGKSWLTRRLEEHFGRRAVRVSLDDFYRDRSHLSPARRLLVNYDHPNAIDWTLFETWLRGCRNGKGGRLPRYDFQSHCRLTDEVALQPASLVLIEGLWLLRSAATRKIIDFSIFIDCPAEIRLAQRQARDVAERGRSAKAVEQQFKQFVSPMHERYVAPQMRWADMVLAQPIGEADVYRVAVRLEALLTSSQTKAGRAQRAVPLSRASLLDKNGFRALATYGRGASEEQLRIACTA